MCFVYLYSCNKYSETLECDHPDNLTTLLIRPLFDRPILVFLYNSIIRHLDNLGWHKSKWHGVSGQQQKQMKTTDTTTTHIRLHKCSLCIQSFQRSADLRSHMVSHQGNRSFQCLMCLKNICQKEYPPSSH